MSAVNDNHNHSHALDKQPSSDGGNTNFQGGETLTVGPSVVDGRRYPRGGDYEAQYFATQDVPDFKKVARIGNPTALPIASFTISLFCASFALMGWGNMEVTGLYPLIGIYIFLGGMGMAVGAIGELIVGNAFAYCVFFTFAAYWLAFSSVFNGSFGVTATTTALGADGPRIQGVALAFWQGCYIVLDLIYLICALRTNLVFVGIFSCLLPAFTLLTIYFGAYKLSATTLMHCAQAAGAFGFVTSCLGAYLLLSILLAEVQGPTLPVGDLSGYWAKKKEAKEKNH